MRAGGNRKWEFVGADMATSEREFIFAPRIPRGLGSAVEGLAREILRHRPRDIYGFAAHHFEELVKLREKVRDAGAAVDSPARNGQQDHILDWDHSRARKIVDFIEEKAIKELVVPAAATVSKLEKRRKEPTTYRRSGWSINQTVVVLKRHEYSSVDRTEKLDTNRQHPEECTSRSLRKMTRGQFALRSLSAGDVPAKTTIECQLKDNREKFCNCVSSKYSRTDTTARTGEGKGGEYFGNAMTATTLKRQSSADEFERRCCSSVDESKHHRYVTDSRKTRSATNGRCKRNGTTTDDTEQGFRHSEKAVVQQLSLKAGEEEEEESKIIIDELGPTTLDCESRFDAFQDPNHGSRAVNGKITENPSLSIVLPSVVVARPSSSVNSNNSNGHDGYSKNGSRNHAYYDSREENSHSNDLILPPISSDVSKPIKKENILTLPYLHTTSTSKATDLEAGQRPATNAKERLKADALLETCNPEAVNCDYDSVSVQHETVDPNAKVEDTSCKHETDEISALARTDEGDVLEELEVARHLNLPETDVDESFKDSLNVTPDSIELEPRPDSLEQVREKNSPIPMQVDDNEAEERMGEELECRRQSSELKNKLIEIETVERSIENALVSSGSGPGSPMPPTSFRSFEAGESSSLRGNETILFSTGTRKQANSEEDAPTIDDSSQHAKLNEGQGTDVVERPNVRAETFDKPSKGIDLSCYVLTEGSPCEIPESVTTVIISDKIEQRDDAALKSDREAIENSDDDDDDVASKPRSSLWNREMRQELEEEEYPFPKGKEDDPFGEYVCPEAGIGYSTSVDLDLLGGMKMNTVDRSTTCQNLGNIKEEEENEKQVSVLPADVVGHVDSSPSENISSVRTDSEPLRTGQDTRADEGVDTSSIVCSKEHGEASALNDCIRDSSSASSLLDATGPPYVPELDLDSLRDATIVSSFERSDSRNHPQKSDKENDDDITIHEDGQTLSSIDTLSSGKKAIVDQPLPSNSQLLPDVEELSNVREQEQLTKIENEIGQCCDKIGGQDSPSTEEEIARELIENLTLETPAPTSPILGEIPNTENTTLPSPVAIGSVDVTSALCPETPTTTTITTTTTSYQGERTNSEIQDERKDGSCCPLLSETSNGQLENDDSTASFLETACETRSELDNVPKDQDQDERDESDIKANSSIEDTKEMHMDSSVENETPPDANTATAAVRKSEVWTRESELGERSSPTTADGDPKPIQQVLHQLSAQTEGTSEEYLEESPSSNDQRHEHLEDRGQCKELDASATTTTTTRWSDVRQTGEFHDSLPLPLLEFARSGTLSKDVSGLTRVYKHCEPDAPTFAFGSPQASVLCSCTVDLSETLRLISNESDWSSPCSKLPFRVVLSGSDDGTSDPRFAKRIVNSANDDDEGITDASLVREPLALVDDETPKSILIEEILNTDEEKERQ